MGLLDAAFGRAPVASSPRLHDSLDHGQHGEILVACRAEVPGPVVARRPAEKPVPEPKVTGQRVEHGLPRPHRLRVAHRHRLPAVQGAHAVRHQAIVGPVAAADDIAGAHRGHARRRRRCKEATPVGGGHQLRTAFARAVRVVSTQSVALAVGPAGLAVLVALVAGDHDHGAQRRARARRLEQVDRAQDVGLVGLDRLIVGAAHQRLSGQVEDDLRLVTQHGGA